jgi:type I restriction enzyme S subunit
VSSAPVQALPIGWRAIRLKWLLSTLESGRREVSDTESFEGGALSIGGEHIGWQGQWQLDHPRYVSREFFSAMSSGKIQKNDVLLVKDGATIGKVAIAKELPAVEAAVNEHVFLLRFSEQNHPNFYFYFIQSSLAQDQIQLEVRGSAQPGLNSEFRNAVVAPQPPIAVQRAIADYLDHETAQIDALVAAKEPLLVLLAEKRRALITRAVTRGLDPRAALRDSGLPWLGEVPAHWRVMRLRWLVRSLEQGWSPDAENREPDEGEWGVLKLNAVNRGSFDPSAAKALPAEFDVPSELEVHPGDFLITRSNTPALVGDSCFVKKTRPKLILCDLIYRLGLLEDEVDGGFLSYFLTVPIGRRQIEADARGTSNSMVKISQEHVKNWWLPVPPLKEQKAIVADVETETVKLDALAAATERSLALLKERRAALIAAAVTGQIGVEESV